MGILGFFTGEFIEIIEWLQGNEDDAMCWKFPHQDNAIKNGAKLIVREGQRALFLNLGALPASEAGGNYVQAEGATGTTQAFVADSFGPGTYTLETKTLPILGRLQGWKYGFESPFKADVYFVATRRFTGLKWGTSSPVMMRDPEFGPVRIRAFGSFAVQVTDPVKLLRQLVATDPSFQTYEIAGQLRSLIVNRFTTVVAGSGIPVLEMAANLDKFGQFVRDRLKDDFEEMGLSLPLFLVENVSLPTELEKVLDKRSSMGILGNLDQYTKLQAANSMELAAGNPGGGAMGMGIGLGAGSAVGQQIAGSLAAASQPQHAAPPPLPTAASFFVGLDGAQAGPFDLNALRGLVAAGRLTPTTLVWKAGMASWTPAAQVPETAPLFGALPPPLPT